MSGASGGEVAARTSRTTDREPLSALLSKTLAAFEQDAVAAFGKDMPALALWANLLRVVEAHGVDMRELPARASVSKRVVRTAVGQAARHGWVIVDESKQPGARGKTRIVRLTEEGQAAHDTWRARLAGVEEEWGQRFGSAAAELRQALLAVVAKFDLELPHYPQSYGPADNSIAGGIGSRWGHPRHLREAGLPRLEFVPADEHAKAEAWEAETGGRLYVGGHGEDWRPVPRDLDHATATVAGLPLVALLAQASVAITIDYEGSGGTALGSAQRFQLFPDEGTRVEGEPAVARALNAARHAYTEVVVDTDGRGGIYRLTDKGRAARDVYRPLLATIEKRWEQRYGRDAVRSLRSTLETIVEQLRAEGR